jgi:S1-C subfamily serine protease
MSVFSKKSFPWVILVLLTMGLWILFNPLEHKRYDPNAQSRAVTARGDLAADEKTTIEIFKNTAPSVVYITSIALRRSLFSLNAVEIPQGTGSGFVWDKQGRIVTNYHVISDANSIKVTMADNSVWKAVLIGTAPDKDLAVIQIEAPSDLLVPIAIGESKNLQVGQKVFAIGNPFGLDHSMTSGIISALGREIKAITGRTIRGAIQTDAAINPGNSGGPLLDSAGRLIGINTAIYSPSGAYAGIGFAVPVEHINKVIPQLIKIGRLIRPGIGVTLADERVTRMLGIDGVIIVAVESGSPSDQAGLQPTRQYQGDIILGDIIHRVNGKKISSPDDFSSELEKFHVGDVVTITLERNGRDMDLKMKLAAVN